MNKQMQHRFPRGKMLNITLLASEWKSSFGGLSTLIRELAINLSQIQDVRVSLLVPEGACNDEDKRAVSYTHLTLPTTLPTILRV